MWRKRVGHHQDCGKSCCYRLVNDVVICLVRSVPMWLLPFGFSTLTVSVVEFRTDSRLEEQELCIGRKRGNDLILMGDMVLMNVNMETRTEMHEGALGVYTIPLFENNLNFTRVLITFTHLSISFLPSRLVDYTSISAAISVSSVDLPLLVLSGMGQLKVFFFFVQIGFDCQSVRRPDLPSS